MTDVLLGLGSNVSYDGYSPVELLGRACGILSKLLDGFVFSSVYRTSALYVTDQSDFYNMAVRGSVGSESPYELLSDISRIETVLGRDRNREIRFGPRSMDIDIEFFGTVSMNEPLLQIPHPRLHERAFILVPLLEILVESADFIRRKKLDGYLRQLPDQNVRMFLSNAEFRSSFFPEANCGTE